MRAKNVFQFICCIRSANSSDLQIRRSICKPRADWMPDLLGLQIGRPICKSDEFADRIQQLKSDFCGVECLVCDACYQLNPVLEWHSGARLRTTDVQIQANQVAIDANLHDLNVDDVRGKRKCVYYATEGLRSIAEA